MPCGLIDFVRIEKTSLVFRFRADGLHISENHVNTGEEVVIFAGDLFQIFPSHIGDAVVNAAAVVGNGRARNLYVPPVGHSVNHAVGILNLADGIALLIENGENLINGHVFLGEKRENQHFG